MFRLPKSSETRRHVLLELLRLVSFVDWELISKHVWDLIFCTIISFVMFFFRMLISNVQKKVMVINSIETRFSRNVSAARLLKKTMINQSVVRSGLLSISRMSKITLTKQTGYQMLLFLWFFSFNTRFEILFFQIFHTTPLLKNCSSQMNSSTSVTPCPAIIISSWFFCINSRHLCLFHVDCWSQTCGFSIHSCCFILNQLFGRGY